MSSPFKRLKEVYARTYSLDTGRDADFFDCVNDIYFSPEVQSLKKYPQHDKMDRLQHITSVAYTGTRSSPLQMRNYSAADLTEKVK